MIYTGIGHSDITIYVININKELNNAVQNANKSLSSPEQTNEIARKNFNFIIYQVLNRN